MRLFAREVQQDPLSSLNDVITRMEYSPASIKPNTTNNLKPLKCSPQQWTQLRPQLKKLHSQLQNKNHTHYYKRNIAQKAAEMIIKLDDYLHQKYSLPPNKAKEKRLLNKTKKAREAFYNAFEFSQTKNAILLSIALAILGTVAAFFLGTSMLAGAALGALAGVSLIEIRRKLLIKNPPLLKPLAMQIYTDAGAHFPIEEAVSPLISSPSVNYERANLIAPTKKSAITHAELLEATSKDTTLEEPETAKENNFSLFKCCRR